MNRIEKLRYLNDILLEEMPEYRGQAEAFPADTASQRKLLRSLMNVRAPKRLSAAFLTVQDELLAEERQERGVVESSALPAIAADSRLVLWQGDITRLRVDAVVNAANSALLGCFCPCHNCIDNVIHSAAGLQLRETCNTLMAAQGHEEPTGQAKITPAFNLPSRYVLHTVGPIIQTRVSQRDRELLASCYRSCLELAAENGLESIAFCCISTGVFCFPNQEAAEIAVKTVTDFLNTPSSIKKVIFNVFKDIDAEIYRTLLGPDQTAEGNA